MADIGTPTELINATEVKLYLTSAANQYVMLQEIDLVINIPKNTQEEELTNDYIIRRKAVDFGVNLITNIQIAQRLAESLVNKDLKGFKFGKVAHTLYDFFWHDFCDVYIEASKAQDDDSPP